MTVAYVWSQEQQSIADQLPANVGRSSVVHSLVRSLGLLEECNGARVIAPDPTLGTRERLLRYHTPAYVDYILGEEQVATDSESDSDGGSEVSKAQRHGLEHDCPHFDALPSYTSIIAAGTQSACRALATGEAQIAFNWDGGRHHALRDRASGFCYVADIQLGIMLLMKEDQAAVPRRKPRIMYLDFDLHYGDGVASAFHSPTSFPTQGADAIRRAKLRVPQVLTLSIHHSSRAFYPPPTPLSQLPSPTTPHLYSLSMPLHAYPSAKTYAAIWPSIQAVHDAYKPDYVVLQLGADGLPSDPVGQWGNWSTHGVGGMLWVAQKVKEWSLPLCVLGGGGYNNPNTARAWAGVTSVMLGKSLEADSDIPHHDYFPDYAPDYTLGVSEGGARDENTEEHITCINEVFTSIAERISDLNE